MRYFPGARLPSGVPVTLVHARGDDVIDFADSVQLARTGSADRIQLLARDDDHALSKFCSRADPRASTLSADSELVSLVAALHDAQARS